MKTNTGLIEYCRAQLGKPYWFGTAGQIATEELHRYNKQRFPSYYAASDFSKQYGQRVHDCAGLIKGYLWSDTPEAVPKYADGCPDISADQMKKLCTETGKIETLPEIHGVLLFKSQHVGVYIGGGKVIEAKGHAYGVVTTDEKTGKWDSWGKLKYLTYEEEDEMQTRYKTINDVPQALRKETQELIDAGALKGNGKGLDVTEDMLRSMIIMKRYIDNGR